MDTGPPFKLFNKQNINQAVTRQNEQHVISTEEATKKTNNICNKPIATTYLSVDYPVVGEETEGNAVPDEGVLHL